MDAMEIDGDLAASLVEVARRAGIEIMKIYATDFTVRQKADSSPVTEADEIAEILITASLAELTPQIPVVGEEAHAAGARPDIGGGTFWLVDALDGTKEFTKRSGEFTVNLGLIRDGAPVFGVVHAPAIGETYWGGVGGVWRQTADGAPAAIQARAAGADGLVVLTSRSHRSTEVDFLKQFKVAEEIHAGSSIKFCRIAAGEADLYPRLGPTHEWDTAAGDAIVRAAGGSVRTMDGRPLAYGKKDLLNPHFLVRGRAA